MRASAIGAAESPQKLGKKGSRGLSDQASSNCKKGEKKILEKKKKNLKLVEQQNQKRSSSSRCAAAWARFLAFSAATTSTVVVELAKGERAPHGSQAFGNHPMEEDTRSSRSLHFLCRGGRYNIAKVLQEVKVKSIKPIKDDNTSDDQGLTPPSSQRSKQPVRFNFTRAKIRLEL